MKRSTGCLDSKKSKKNHSKINKRRYTWKKVLLTTPIVTLLFIQLINAQLAIMVRFGEPKITHISYSNEKIDIAVKNVGKDIGAFQIITTCTHNWEVGYGFYSAIQVEPGEIKDVEIPLVCLSNSLEERIQKCYGMVNCEVSIQDMEGSFLTGKELKDTKSISFNAQRPILCGTPKATCYGGEKRCDGNKLLICTNYCDGYEPSQVCDYKCEWKDTSYRCVSKREEELERAEAQRKETWSTIQRISVVLFIIAIMVVPLKLWRRYKKLPSCPFCGAELGKGDIFCQRCGKKVK